MNELYHYATVPIKNTYSSFNSPLTTDFRSRIDNGCGSGCGFLGVSPLVGWLASMWIDGTAVGMSFNLNCNATKIYEYSATYNRQVYSKHWYSSLLETVTDIIIMN